MPRCSSSANDAVQPDCFITNSRQGDDGVAMSGLSSESARPARCDRPEQHLRVVGGVAVTLVADSLNRRRRLAHNTGHSMDAAGNMAFTAEEVRGSIENLVGATHIPLGIAGPIRVNGA